MIFYFILLFVSHKHPCHAVQITSTCHENLTIFSHFNTQRTNYQTDVVMVTRSHAALQPFSAAPGPSLPGFSALSPKKQEQKLTERRQNLT